MKRDGKLTKFGFFNVDKPSGIVSSTVVNKCKWLSGLPCGHMGTLDPLASGVLPVGVGNATRLFDYFLNKQKEYIAELTFGVTSDTLDSTGEMIYGGEIPGEEQIRSILPKFIGELMQIPPKYSAKNVNGKRGYDLARAGVEFTLPPKKIEVFHVELLGKSEQTENAFRLQIRCGGGTYIRSLARDIAAELGTQAVMSALRRTQSGAFTLENAVPFSVFENDPTIEELERYLIPTDKVLPLPTIYASGKEADKFLHGLSVNCEETDGLYKLELNGAFYGVAEVNEGKAKAKIKLC